MQKLFGLTLTELQAVCQKMGLQKFAAKQIADWLYKKHVTSIDEMSNLSLKNRELLKTEYEVGRMAAARYVTSVDGTRKYLFVYDAGSIETAYIPDGDRGTLCVSSQVGCKMNCLFCMTGKQGFAAHLTTCEILNQIASVEERDSLTNYVFMGMGEPLDNYENLKKALEIMTSDWGYALSPRRITVSSIGVKGYLQRLIEETEVHVAISMHSPYHIERESMMPVERAFPIDETIALLKNYDWSGQRRLTFEYTLFKGVNDGVQHADAVARKIKGLECRVNLIKFNQIPNVELRGCNDKEMQEFVMRLNKNRVTATIRHSKGEDIEAACGMLSTKDKEKSE